MAHLYNVGKPLSQYKDRQFDGTLEEYRRALEESTTLYVGNLNFYTTEEQILEVFGKCGEVASLKMGLDRFTRKPCGFCFVMYYSRADAACAVSCINGMAVDERAVRVDFDWGFVEGREYGRGSSGGQVRDEYRQDFDPGRGGAGRKRGWEGGGGGYGGGGGGGGAYRTPGARMGGGGGRFEPRTPQSLPRLVNVPYGTPATHGVLPPGSAGGEVADAGRRKRQRDQEDDAWD